jgi:hypothetical protein
MLLEQLYRRAYLPGGIPVQLPELASPSSELTSTLHATDQV